MLELDKMDSKQLREQADHAKARADELYKMSHDKYIEELKAIPLFNRMIFAAYDRCPCGAGLAYDPAAINGHEGRYWDCSDIILGHAIPKGKEGSVKHTDKLPFAFWEIKSESQPSVGGATTRGKL